MNGNNDAELRAQRVDVIEIWNHTLIIDRHSMFVSDPDFAELIRPHQPLQRPPILYHYTDALGLKGIVESKSLWLTHFKYTNDFTEVMHGTNCARLILERTIPQSNSSEHPESVIEYLSGENPSCKPSDVLLKAVLATLQTPQIEESTRYRYFLASFCEFGDQLSQWRAYAHDASGFAVGLSSDVIRNDELIRGLEEDKLGDTADLLKVIYDEEVQVAIIESLIKTACRRVDTLIPKLPPEKRYDALMATNVWFATSFLRMALLFKHSGFSEEGEWRLILLKSAPEKSETQTNNPIRTRTTAFGITPYVAIPLCESNEHLKLEHVVAGPKCGGALRSASTFGLDVLCSQLAGGRPVNGITLSETPYR